MTKDVQLKSLKRFHHFLESSSSEHESFSALLERHKVGGLYKESYPEFYKKYWIINKNYQEFIEKELLSTSLKGTLLKGAHLINRYYPEIGMRFLGDIDVLVDNDEDFNLWELELTKLGFREYAEKRWEANDFKKIFIREKGGIEVIVELHSRLFFQQDEDYHLSIIPLFSSQITCLDKEELFVHLCGHLVYQHTFHSLNWLFDILLLLESEEINFSRVEEISKKLKVYRSCEIVLEVLRVLFDYKHGSTTLYNRLVTRIFINKEFLLEPYRNRLKYAFVKMFIKDSLWQALVYNWKWIKTIS